MQREQLGYWIDGVALVNLAALAATGLLLEFRLPPGSGGEHVLQVGVEAGRRLTVWGLSRHEWGSIHLCLSMAFLALMSAHIFLHWRWIWAFTRGKDPDGQSLRIRQFLAFVGLVLLILLLPWLVPVRERQRGRSAPTNAGTRWEGTWRMIRPAMEHAGLSRDRLHNMSAPSAEDNQGSGEPGGGNNDAGS